MTAIRSPVPPASRTAWLAALRPVLPAAALGLAGWAALFHAEIVAAVHVWLDSTAYSHCLFVLPIALWLAWDRRHAARGLRPRPTLWPVLAILPFGLAWFAAERLGLMEGRQLAALFMVEALLVALLGWRLARVFAGALAYLVFLVPFGSFLVPSLQSVTTGFVEAGLEVLGIPHVVDAFTIEVPGATFYVAEACAGLRFLIAAVAFGALYALLTYRSAGRRLAFFAAACVVPVIANGLRALGIVVAGYLIGDAEAAAADHLIYGWGFFSLVIILLTLAGLPFRQDTTPLAAPVLSAPQPPANAAHGLAAACAAVLCMVLAPAGALLLTRHGAGPAPSLPGFAAAAGCVPAAGDAPGPVQHFTCGRTPLTATLRVLPRTASPADLRAARSAATGERDAADAAVGVLGVPGITPQDWRVVELHEPDRISASAAWLRGAPDPGGLSGRLRMALDSVTGGAPPPVLVAVSLRPPSLTLGTEREAAQQILRQFLQAQTGLLDAIPRAVAAPAE